MSYQNIKGESHHKIIIKLKISEIFPLKDDIKNLISDSSLKFDETNNNKYNIYNLLYILNNTIILIPTNTSKIEKLKIDLIYEQNKFISKGILYINKTSDEQIIKFNIMNKYINIKFHYNIYYMNVSEGNKTKRRESIKKSIKENYTKNQDSKLNKNNEILKKKYSKNTSNIINKNSNDIKINNRNKRKKNDDLCPSERKTNFNFNVNKSQIIFPCNLIINNNKETNENKNNFSEIWINDTKMFIKKIKKYITLRNSRNNSQKVFKKCLSAKNIYSFMDCSNKFANSISSRKKSLKDINTNSSNSSTETQKNINRFNIKEINNIKRDNKGKKLNNSASDIKDNSFKKNKNDKYFASTSFAKKYINYNTIKDVKSKLFKNCLESIKIENNNERNNENKIVLNENNYNIEDKNDDINKINLHKHNNNTLYTKKKIQNIYEKKTNLCQIKANDINQQKYLQLNENVFIKHILNDSKNEEKYLFSMKNMNQIDQNNISEIIHSFAEFYRLKNDLYLFYSKKYINNINNDLLKLEIELFFEKVVELISEYHRSIDDEKIIYKFLLSSFRNYNHLYHIYFSLNKKLNKIKQKEKEKNDKLNIKNKDILTYKSEISIFDCLFKNNSKITKENNINFERNNSSIFSKMLKNILIKILNNKNNRNIIIQSDKFKIWVNNNIIQNDEIYYDDKTTNKKENSKNKIKITFKTDK